MLINKTQRSAPAAPTLVAKPGAIQGTWERPGFADYDCMAVYRYPTLTDANNHTNFLFLGTFTDENFVDLDDDLTADVTYYFRIATVDIYKHESAKSTPASITYRIVKLSDTDQTNLPAPTGTPTLTQRNQDVNKDGSVDIALSYTGATVVGAALYEIEVSTGTSATGPWTVSESIMTTSFPKPFIALDGKWYRARHRAISFNNIPSSNWSAYSASKRPDPKTTAPADPTGVYYDPVPLGAQIVYDIPPDVDYAYSNVYVIRETGGFFLWFVGTIERPYSIVYTGDSFPTTHKIAIEHVNTSGVVSNRVTATFGAGIGLLTGNEIDVSAISTTHIAALAVTTGKLDNGAVTNDKLAGDAVTNAKIAAGTIQAGRLWNGDVFNALRWHANSDGTAYTFSTNTTACAYLHNAGLVRASRSSGNAAEFQRTDTNGTIMAFFRGTTQVGSISVTTSATTYGTTSDYRLKYDVQSLVDVDVSSAGDAEYLPYTLLRMMSARPVSYRWKDIDGPDSELTHGFIAHELQAMFPHAVSGEKDDVVDVGVATIERVVEVDKDVIEVVTETIDDVTEKEAKESGAAKWEKTGERIVAQTVDHSKLVPDLVAAVQELTMLVLEQKHEIDALKKRLDATCGSPS